MTHTPFDNASTTYDVGDFIPQTWRGWDDYSSRLARYEILEGYYHNLAYHKIMPYAQQIKVTESMYKHVRGVRNPVRRNAEAIVSKIYGGMLDTETGLTGSIPLQSENETLIESITRLWELSMWGQKKSLYVRNGAIKGDSFIKVVDDIQKEHVRLEPVDPAKVKRIEKEADGTIVYAEFEYYIRDTETGFNRLYREIITPEKIQVFTRENIYRNGRFVSSQIVPFDRFKNARNESVPEWENEYGFVPLIHVQHTDMGMQYGACAVHGTLHKINELNDLASIVNDAMRNQSMLPLVTINAKVGSIDFGADRSTSADNTSDDPKKDTMKVLNISGTDADIKTLAPTLNVADALQAILAGNDEIEKDMPLLSLHRLRDSSNLTAPGVRSAYDDAIAQVQDIRNGYDNGLVKAQKMALWMMDYRRYENAPSINAPMWDDDGYAHQIAARPVISDTLGLNEQLNLTLQGLSANAPKSFYVKAGWSESEANDIVSGIERAKRREQRMSIRNLLAQNEVADRPATENDISQNGVEASDIAIGPEVA
jgi:hypothetical protein